MNAIKTMRVRVLVCIILVQSALLVNAEESSIAYGVSGVANVADNIRIMDTNRDGLVSADEVAAFIRLKSSLRFDDQTLKQLEAEMQGQRCGSPFSGAMY